MFRISSVLPLPWLVVTSACLEVPGDNAPLIESVEQESRAYRPMGFARVSAAGGVVTAFNSAEGAVTATRTAAGTYYVAFSGLGTISIGPGSLGNVQITAEGTGNIRCQLEHWDVTELMANIEVSCYAPDATLADSAFAVLYTRDTMPTRNTWLAESAYARVTSNGFLIDRENFNSSGELNTTAWLSTGRNQITVPWAASTNASLMLTSVAGVIYGPHVCGLMNWSIGSSGGTAKIECRTTTGYLVNTGLSFLYSTTGPSVGQQGAHAVFTGSAIDPTRSAALGRLSGCSAATVSGSQKNSLATMVVSGDLGSHDDSPFVRASFVTPLGAPGYCKVESSTVSGTAPSSTATVRVRCYDPSGKVWTTPVFSFVHVTSDVSNPC